MRKQAEISEQVLREIESELCSGTGQSREQRWRRLVLDLRRRRRDPESAADALTEFLGEKGRAYGPGSPLRWVHRDYHTLPPAERDRLDERYRECLEAAKREFPRIFHVQVINVPSAPADTWLAERIARDQLPRLNADHKSIAKAFDISEEEYARGMAARQISEDRYRLHAERCWDLLMEAARPRSIDAVDVIYDVSSRRFYCELGHDGNAWRFFLDARLISEPLERGDRAGLEKARDSIQFAVDNALVSPAGTAPPQG